MIPPPGFATEAQHCRASPLPGRGHRCHRHRAARIGHEDAFDLSWTPRRQPDRPRLRITMSAPSCEPNRIRRAHPFRSVSARPGHARICGEEWRLTLRSIEGRVYAVACMIRREIVRLGSARTQAGTPRAPTRLKPRSRCRALREKRENPSSLHTLRSSTFAAVASGRKRTRAAVVKEMKP